MTPLARHFAKDMTLPKKRRRCHDGAHIIERMEDMHCFETSAIVKAVGAAKEGITSFTDYLQFRSFLPSPRTWLEFHGWEGGWTESCYIGALTAIYAEELNDGWVRYSEARKVNGRPTSIPIGRVKIDRSNETWSADFRDRIAFYQEMGEPTPSEEGMTQSLLRVMQCAWIMLDVINQPGAVNMHSRPMDRGLQTRLKSFSGGTFPLNAWHEVVINPEMFEGDNDPHPSGKKCLHFVRRHVRRLPAGRETIVTHHWRGDASLGIAQTKYRVDAGGVR